MSKFRQCPVVPSGINPILRCSRKRIGDVVCNIEEVNFINLELQIHKRRCCKISSNLFQNDSGDYSSHINRYCRGLGKDDFFAPNHFKAVFGIIGQGCSGGQQRCLRTNMAHIRSVHKRIYSPFAICAAQCNFRQILYRGVSIQSITSEHKDLKRIDLDFITVCDCRGFRERPVDSYRQFSNAGI